MFCYVICYLLYTRTVISDVRCASAATIISICEVNNVTLDFVISEVITIYM